MSGEDDVGFDNPLQDFAESAEAPSLIASLPHICNDPYALEASQEKFLGMLLSRA